MLNDLIEELDKLWNSSDDERYKGENPACADVLNAIENKFLDMTDDEIKKVLDGLSDEQLEQLFSVFEDMVDEREFMEGYM